MIVSYTKYESYNAGLIRFNKSMFPVLGDKK